MAIDVPYHYESAPRMEQNVRIESQNNWYLGAYREATDIKVVDNTALAQKQNSIHKETPALDRPGLNGAGKWTLKPKGERAAKKAPLKRKLKATHKPECTEKSLPSDDCLAPK